MAAKGEHNNPRILDGLEGVVPGLAVPRPREAAPTSGDEESPDPEPGGREPSDVTAALAEMGVISLAQLLKDPGALQPPCQVVPRLVWGGRVTLLAVPEKCGKSTLASAAAAAVTRGAHLFGETCRKGPVLWASFDREHPSDLLKRLLRFGVVPEALFLLQHLAHPLEEMQRIATILEPALVVIDTLSKLGELCDVTDAASSAAWSPIMSALTGIARDTEAGVLPLHHSRRSDGAYRDSSAIGAGVDIIFEMSADTKQHNLRHLRGKGRFAIPDTSLALEGDAYELVSGALPLSDRIVEFVSVNPGCSVRALRDRVTGKTEEISEAVQGLLAAGQLENRGTSDSYKLHLPEIPGTAAGTTLDGEAVPAVPPVEQGGYSPGTDPGTGGGSRLQSLGVGTGNRHTPNSDREVEVKV